jgi:hypothetical protein
MSARAAVLLVCPFERGTEKRARALSLKATDLHSAMDAAEWLAVLCSALESVEPGSLVESVYDARDVAVKFQRDGDEFTGYATLKDDPRGGVVGGRAVPRMGPRITRMSDSLAEIVHAIRSARSSRL